MCIDRKLSLTMVRPYAFHHCMHYHSGISSCCKTLAVPGMRFVDRKLSLTTMVRLDELQNCMVNYHSGLSSSYKTLLVLVVSIL